MTRQNMNIHRNNRCFFVVTVRILRGLLLLDTREKIDYVQNFVKLQHIDLQLGTLITFKYKDIKKCLFKNFVPKILNAYIV